MSNINVSVVGECIVTWKAENRKFKAAVQLSNGWLEGEGGQTRGAVAQVKAALAGMGLQAPTTIKTKEEFLGQPAVQKQGRNAAPIQARIVQSLDFGSPSQAPQGSRQSSIPASSLSALESVLGSAQSQAPQSSAPAPGAWENAISSFKSTGGFDEMLSAPADAPAKKSEEKSAEKSEEKPAEKPKFQKGRKLETCYDWGAAMSDAARLRGASPEKQRIAYKFAYVVSAKCGAKDAVQSKVEKFSDAVSHLNLNISLDDIRAQLVSAGVQLRA